MTDGTEGTIGTSASAYGTDAAGELCLRRLRARVAIGPDRGVERALEGGSLVIGTGPAADLRLSDSRASRAHVELALVAGRVRVRDLGSTNGTFLGEARVEAVRVTPPCTLRIGRSEVELLFDDLPAPALPAERTWFGPLVGHGLEMRRIFALLERVAPTDTSVLLEGEAGVGKALAARAIHDASPRAAGPFVVLDGAAAARAQDAVPVAAAADGGTLVVRDVDRVTAEVARALLDRMASCDVRVVATSRVDVRAAVERGAIPRALYFEVAAVRARLPPLRDRPDDLHALCVALASGEGRHDFRPPPALLRRLRALPLEGNVRELRALLRAELSAQGEPGAGVGAARAGEAEGYKEARQRVVDTFERDYVVRLLARHDGNVSRAAAEAGISRNHLGALVKKHGLR